MHLKSAVVASATVVAFALCVAGCGSSDPVAPSSVTPTSVATPQPVYPNMVGAWSGTTSITVQQGAARATNICTSTWIVDTQGQSNFAGTFQLSGGTIVACAQSGNFAGTVSTQGSITVAYATTGGGSTGCTTVGGDTAFTGVVSGSSLTAQETLHLNCGGLATDQINQITLSRR